MALVGCVSFSYLTSTTLVILEVGTTVSRLRSKLVMQKCVNECDSSPILPAFRKQLHSCGTCSFDKNACPLPWSHSHCMNPTPGNTVAVGGGHSGSFVGTYHQKLTQSKREKVRRREIEKRHWGGGKDRSCRVMEERGRRWNE